MKNVFIIGGAGKIARRLAQQLLARGHQPRSMYRHPEQEEELRNLGALPIKGSLIELDVFGLAQLLKGSDAVVFSAGAGGKGGPEMTDAIDGRGLELSVAAAKLAGIQRFILVSAFPESFRSKKMPDSFENYMAVKKIADVHLVESGLDWVIVRPGTLLDSQGNGKIRAGLAIPYGDISRDDVASALAEIIDRPKVSRVIIELTSGEVPIGTAIMQMETK
ncbi:SDR family oxidoreductase [Citrobacter freundii]|uniref:SDR family oxidoreductase n=1 Tax=Citrobacter TaxID=544 RepID=UPI00214D7D1B|nr:MULTISPECIES: SDR family oxidoreductase [Citrobacter]MCR3713749.1 SDR family oxidoreductase [Citrobacter freundii]MDM3231783.1 SDR family oxidoreductase [Citrobacter sp. Cf078]